MKVLLILLLPVFALAGTVKDKTFSATACHSSYERALKLALGDLSNTIYVEVESTQTVVTGDRESYKQTIVLRSELPIFAYAVKDHHKQNGCLDVELRSSEAASEYTAKAVEVAKQIRRYHDLIIKAESDAEKVKLYNLVAKELELLGKLNIVLGTFGVKAVDSVLSITDVRAALIKLETISSDPAKIAANIKSQLKTNHNITQVLTTDGKSTPLAKLLTAELAKDVKTTSDAPALKCTYSVLGGESPIILSCLTPDTVVTTLIDRELCRRIECVKGIDPAYNFSTTNAYRGRIYTDYGVENLTFHSGDVVRIYAKVNASGTLYLLNNEKVVKVIQVGESQVDREILLATLKVTAPFGEEVLSVVGFRGTVAPEKTPQIMDEKVIRSIVKDGDGYFKSVLTVITFP